MAATPCGARVSAMASITCFETSAPRHCTRRSKSSKAAPRSLDSSSAVKATLSKCAPALIASSIKRTPSRNTCGRSPIVRTRRKRLTRGFWRLVIFSTSMAKRVLGVSGWGLGTDQARIAPTSGPQSKTSDEHIHRPTFDGKEREAKIAKHRHLEYLDVAQIRNGISPFRKRPVVPELPQRSAQTAGGKQCKKPLVIPALDVADD